MFISSACEIDKCFNPPLFVLYKPSRETRQEFIKDDTFNFKIANKWTALWQIRTSFVHFDQI